MKDITLKIVGKQCFNGQEEDQMEFITDGKLYTKNDAVYVMYEESSLSGLEGCKTTLKMNGDTVRMKRIGGTGAEMYFEKGKRFTSKYQTPYGPMDLEIVTSWVKNSLDAEAGKGVVDIEYNVSLQGLAEGKNRLTIDIM